MLIAAHTASAVRDTVEEIRAAGGSGDGIVADLSTRGGAHALADAAGAVDVLVNSAGINRRLPMPDLDEETWDATMRVNLKAPFILGQRLAPGMAERAFGRIIHINSQQARRPFAASGAYGVSKAALEALVRSQSDAWAPQGVTANVLVPGSMRTPLNERLSSDPDTVQALAGLRGCSRVPGGQRIGLRRRADDLRRRRVLGPLAASPRWWTSVSCT